MAKCSLLKSGQARIRLILPQGLTQARILKCVPLESQKPQVPCACTPNRDEVELVHRRCELAQWQAALLLFSPPGDVSRGPLIFPAGLKVYLELGTRDKRNTMAHVHPHKAKCLSGAGVGV